MKWHEQRWARSLPAEVFTRLENLAADGEQVTEELALEEGRDILECFEEGGHVLSEALDDEDPEARKAARRCRAQVKAWVAKMDRKLARATKNKDKGCA